MLDTLSSTEILLFVIIIASHIELSYLKFDVVIIAQSENAFKIFFTDTGKKIANSKISYAISYTMPAIDGDAQGGKALTLCHLESF